jgi:uncharacterized membrane protein YjgN (DUF898 family)
MSDADATLVPAEQTAPGTGTGRFTGPEGPFWRLLVRGAGLLILSLGLYRFWLVTDVRRYLWLHSEVAGDGLEYIGTARELLLGFLIAIALLVPINAAFFIAALDLGVLGRVSGLIAVLFLAFLGHFAVYRARRYRLSRTLYRGIRFRQTGAAWRYAIRALLWWGLVIVTAGLAYPWMVTSLERVKMDNTHYGDAKGRFEGSAFGLFFRGLLMWLLVMVPMVFGLFASVGSIQWGQLAEALQRGGDVMADLESAGVTSAVIYGLMAIGWGVVMAALLYPIFQAMMLRWWISGLRFGRITLSSRLRTAGVYAAYVRFMWYGLVAGIVIAIVATMGLLGISLTETAGQRSKAAEIGATAFLVLIYVLVALTYSTIYQATVRLRLWMLAFDTLALSGLDALDQVRAVDATGSPIGEGLADALNVGGI